MIKVFSAFVMTLLLLSPFSAAGDEVFVLGEAGSLELDDAVAEGRTLWIDPADLPAVMGFELKPEGACRADICIPVREGEPDSLVRDEGERRLISPTRLADVLGQAYVVDTEAGVWSFGPPAKDQAGGLVTVEAPDFALPNLEGETVRLSDLRGKKVLLITWASW